jgi:hypothetical protein
VNRHNRPSTSPTQADRHSATPDRVVAFPVYSRAPAAFSRRQTALTVWIAPMARVRTALTATLGTTARPS